MAGIINDIAGLLGFVPKIEFDLADSAFQKATRRLRQTTICEEFCMSIGISTLELIHDPETHLSEFKVNYDFDTFKKALGQLGLVVYQLGKHGTVPAEGLADGL